MRSLYYDIELPGNYYTQIVSNLANTAGAVLLALVTWQFTLSPPHCCHSQSYHGGNNDSSSTHCYEMMKEQLFSSADMHFTSSVVMLLATLGLLVCGNKPCEIFKKK